MTENKINELARELYETLLARGIEYVLKYDELEDFQRKDFLDLATHVHNLVIHRKIDELDILQFNNSDNPKLMKSIEQHIVELKNELL